MCFLVYDKKTKSRQEDKSICLPPYPHSPKFVNGGFDPLFIKVLSYFPELIPLFSAAVTAHAMILANRVELHTGKRLAPVP